MKTLSLTGTSVNSKRSDWEIHAHESACRPAKWKPSNAQSSKHCSQLTVFLNSILQSYQGIDFYKRYCGPLYRVIT